MDKGGVAGRKRATLGVYRGGVVLKHTVGNSPNQLLSLWGGCKGREAGKLECGI